MMYAQSSNDIMMMLIMNYIYVCIYLYVYMNMYNTTMMAASIFT